MVELGYNSALIGCFLALNRRALFTPEKLKGKSQLEGNVILLLIMTICTTSYIVEAGENPHPTWEMIGAWVADIFAPSQTTINGSLLGAYGRHLYILISDTAFKAHAFGYGTSNVAFYDTEPMAKMRPLATDESGSVVSLEELDLNLLVQPITRNRPGGVSSMAGHAPTRTLSRRLSSL